jgi:hypothetical protein
MSPWPRSSVRPAFADESVIVRQRKRAEQAKVRSPLLARSVRKSSEKEAKMEASSKKMQAVYTVVPRAEGRDLWLRIGSAFPNRDGSLTVYLDAVPINGRLQIREYQPRDGATQTKKADVEVAV